MTKIIKKSKKTNKQCNTKIGEQILSDRQRLRRRPQDTLVGIIELEISKIYNKSARHTRTNKTKQEKKKQTLMCPSFCI